MVIGFLSLGIVRCSASKTELAVDHSYGDVKVVGAMRNVMWKGELDSQIDLDTIALHQGLYGLGPETFLRGEVLINEGSCYVLRVTSDSTMAVQKTYDVSAPFFVYTHVEEWNEMELPANIKTIRDLERLISEKASTYNRPFAFKLNGKVANALIHIQNLPEGTRVSSPGEAHQGQVNYELYDQPCEIIGFFSTNIRVYLPITTHFCICT